jgi:hypothetical protein
VIVSLTTYWKSRFEFERREMTCSLHSIDSFLETANPQEYRYGFNGKEKDTEWTGNEGSHLAFKYRIHDARIEREGTNQALIGGIGLMRKFGSSQMR